MEIEWGARKFEETSRVFTPFRARQWNQQGKGGEAPVDRKRIRAPRSYPKLPAIISGLSWFEAYKKNGK
jgi:hypothetical protein